MTVWGWVGECGGSKPPFSSKIAYGEGAKKKVKKNNNSAFPATPTYIKLTLVSFFFTFSYAPSPKSSHWKEKGIQLKSHLPKAFTWSFSCAVWQSFLCANKVHKLEKYTIPHLQVGTDAQVFPKIPFEGSFRQCIVRYFLHLRWYWLLSIISP